MAVTLFALQRFDAVIVIIKVSPSGKKVVLNWGSEVVVVVHEPPILVEYLH